MMERGKWVSENMKGLLVMKTDSLAKFEPERNETNWSKILINFLIGSGIIGAVAYIIITNASKVGTLK